MTKLLDEALKQVERLPAEEQDAAAGALMDYLAHRGDLQLTDEQLAEIERRRAGETRTTMSLADVRQRLRSPGA